MERNASLLIDLLISFGVKSLNQLWLWLDYAEKVKNGSSHLSKLNVKADDARFMTSSVSLRKNGMFALIGFM